MKRGLLDAGFPEEDRNQLDKILEELDEDKSGVIDYTEFIASTIDRNTSDQRSF